MPFKASLLAACLALAASLAPASAQVRSNLLVAVDDVVDPVILPAYEVEYAVQVSNLSATPMTGVTVTADTPEGTYFGEASTNVGALEAPAQGRPGKMVVSARRLRSTSNSTATRRSSPSTTRTARSRPRSTAR